MRRRPSVSSVGLGRPAAPSTEPPDIWERHVATLKAHGIDAPGTSRDASRKPATVADEEALYEAGPSFVDLLPWVIAGCAVAHLAGAGAASAARRLQRR